MAASYGSKNAREAVALRASTPGGTDQACFVLGCKRPTQRVDGAGLSDTHCRYHVQFRNRHGSYWKRTYTADYLRPYRQAAERHLKRHLADRSIAGALHGLQLLRWGVNFARPVEWRRLPPLEKAKAALARLRDRDVPPVKILATYLAVTAAVSEDPINPGVEPGEFHLVQVAKAVFRLASGYHRDYGQWGSYHAYPRSSGLVLRHLGKLIDDECRHVAEAHLPAILVRQHLAAAEDAMKAGRSWSAADGE